MPKKRPEILNSILALFAEPRYLEVGVSTGRTFHLITGAKTRTAVDPVFRFDVEQAKSENPNATYHAMTSDDFFGKVVNPTDRFEVIYLDGLHTAEQTLRDLVNAICHLTDDGVIVIDDVMPANFAAAIPDQDLFNKVREATGIERKAWMGDVYRLVFGIETFFQPFSYRTTRENHGQIIMWRGRRGSVPDRTIEAVGRMQYVDCILNKETFRYAPVDDIIAELKARPKLPEPSDTRTPNGGTEVPPLKSLDGGLDQSIR